MPEQESNCTCGADAPELQERNRSFILLHEFLSRCDGSLSKFLRMVVKEIKSAEGDELQKKRREEWEKCMSYLISDAYGWDR